MSLVSKSPLLRHFAAVAVTVLGLCGMTTLEAKAADARVVVVGVGVPAYYPVYWHRHPVYWYRPYWRPYYRAYYPGWRWGRWCYWHPYRCRW